MKPFELTGRLDGESALILASPHSGTHLPDDFLATSRLPPGAIRRIEDAHVAELLRPALMGGVPLIAATHSRAVIDLNRAEDELDPAMFAGAVVRQPRQTDRVRRGFGLFPRVAAGNQAIHTGRLPVELARARIAQLHRPWHQAIEAGMGAAFARHGHAVLLDMHSMPPLEGAGAAQVVLGDLNGESAGGALVDWLQQAFEAGGLRVGRNSPYAGGHTTERHGQPARGFHCVQIELDRTIYMHTGTLEPHGGFAGLSQLIADVVAGLREALPRLGLEPNRALAAE